MDKKQFSLEITERFLIAMEMVMSNKKYGKVSAKEFGKVVTIASSNLNRIALNPKENFATIEAIGRLCDHYKISATWLICGIGKPDDDNETLAAYQTLGNKTKEIKEAIQSMDAALEVINMR